MVSAGIPVSQERQGISRSDRMRPEGLSLVFWEAGKATDLGCDRRVSVGRLTSVPAAAQL